MRSILTGMYVVVFGAGSLLHAQSAAWVIGPWARASDAPVITPRKESVFDDPVSGGAVHWEALHTFNPAAMVRGGKVYVLYRAEDDSGEMKIGMHASVTPTIIGMSMRTRAGETGTKRCG